MRILTGLVVAVLFVAGFGYLTYSIGRHQSYSVTWASEYGAKGVRFMPNNQGQGYFIDVIAVCGNGRVLGPLQVDFNVRNGKFRVVRNDAGIEPDCSHGPMLPPPISQPSPVPEQPKK